MNNDNWPEVVEAWSKWVQGRGPMIQGRLVGHDGWENYHDREYLKRQDYDEWRVAPLVYQARMIKSGPAILVIRKKSNELSMYPDDSPDWIGEWVDLDPVIFPPPNPIKYNETLPDLQPVIDWLENGLNVKDAVIELKTHQNMINATKQTVLGEPK